MRTESVRSARLFCYSDPTIFESHRGKISYSSNATKTEIVVPGSGEREASAMRYEVSWALPDRERTPKHAVYDFSVEVSKIREVKAISYQVENGIIRVWTFIPRRERSIQRLIYNKEMQLMLKYPELIFDFNVICFKSLSERFIPDDMYGGLSFFRNH